ncbi:hypothetical protein E8E14_008418 [Neopestalotiopsis sp. 37M]|nr:hypothetical protein E8E14_008418 [Neopestalotiopsis sp. 37M]
MQSTTMGDFPDLSDSLAMLEKPWASASLSPEELPIELRTPSSQPVIRYSLASSTHGDDFEQKNAPELSTTDRKAPEHSERRSPRDDDRYSSSTDFLSVVTVEDLGFASSWSHQVQKYAAIGCRTNIHDDSVREEQGEQRVQHLTEGSPMLNTGNQRSFGDQFPPMSSIQPPTIQELSEYLGGITDNEMVSTDPVKYLCNQLLLARELSEHEFSDGTNFIPHNKLCTILNDCNVFCLLKHTFPLDVGTRIRDRAAEICSREYRSSRRMILAILVIVGQPSYIDDFISHKIYDIDLPLRTSKERTSGQQHQIRKNLFHKKQDEHDSEPHAVFEHWSPKDMMDFLQWQYLVLSPFLKMKNDRVCFYKIEGKIILPFIECHEPKETQVGGHGAVWKVKFHPAHHDFEGPKGDKNPFFALKAIFSEKYEHIRDEVQVLERFSELLDKNLGRHGDVKPENLLWFNNETLIVIADFGLTRFHSAQAGSALTIPKNLRGFSRTYRPPEFSLEAPVSQKCDVWSLGCVYLEFITWYLLGHEKTRGEGAGTFVKLRLEDDDRSSHIQEDKFFNVAQEDGQVEYIVDVKESVKNWIIDLRRLESCSAAIGAFLDMIETEMLVPDTQTRAKMDLVHRKMKNMVDECLRNDEYCTSQTHAGPVSEKPKALPAIGELRHSVVIQGPSGYGVSGDLDCEGDDDLDTLVDKKIRGLLEQPEHATLIEVGDDGITASPLQTPTQNTPEDQSAAVIPASIVPGSTAERLVPDLLNQETTYTGLESQFSAADMTSSSATSLSPTARSSYEEVRSQEHMTSEYLGATIASGRNGKTLENICSKVLGLPENDVIEIPAQENGFLSPSYNKFPRSSQHTGDQSSQDTRYSHDITDKDIESGLQQGIEHREEVTRPISVIVATSMDEVPNQPKSRWIRMSKKHYKVRLAKIWKSLRRRLSPNKS